MDTSEKDLETTIVTVLIPAAVTGKIDVRGSAGT
jgi:hypothetical protein